MPRYFFNVRDGQQLNEDPEGIDLDGLSAVENEAMTSAKEIIAEALLSGRPAPLGHSFEIIDEEGNMILEFLFARAAHETGPQP
ncbi:hypothetical protein [Mesorhizobium sp. WSM2239]|uniref:DUF6894 domain-containing protein n=2 Tax=unclassified Mesorhizobium TaxID=325217 RepID=A0AAU8DFY7_9HYPH